MAIETKFHALNDAGDFAITRQQNARPFLDYTHELRATGNTGSNDMKLAAEFPDTVVENYINRTGITWREFLNDTSHVARMLSDPDLKGFRVWEGKV